MIFSRCERHRTRFPTAQSLVRRPRRRTRSTPSHNLIKALATCGRGRPRSAVGGFGARQPTTIVGCNCHEIIGKALLCVRCRRWKHSSQVSGAALKMLASLKGRQAVELLGREIYSKYVAPSIRCAPSILAAGWGPVLQWPDRQLFVRVDPPRAKVGTRWLDPAAHGAKHMLTARCVVRTSRNEAMGPRERRSADAAQVWTWAGRA